MVSFDAVVVVAFSTCTGTWLLLPVAYGASNDVVVVTLIAPTFSPFPQPQTLSLKVASGEPFPCKSLCFFLQRVSLGFKAVKKKAEKII